MATYILYRDASPPLSYLYPSRVIDGTPGETILKIMYADFFRTAGMTTQATEMEGVAPAGSMSYLETSLKQPLRHPEEGNLLLEVMMPWHSQG